MQSLHCTQAQMESAPYTIRAVLEFPETGPPRDL